MVGEVSLIEFGLLELKKGRPAVKPAVPFKPAAERFRVSAKVHTQNPSGLNINDLLCGPGCLAFFVVSNILFCLTHAGKSHR